jgi:hypothetical protein
MVHGTNLTPPGSGLTALPRGLGALDLVCLYLPFMSTALTALSPLFRAEMDGRVAATPGFHSIGRAGRTGCHQSNRALTAR